MALFSCSVMQDAEGKRFYVGALLPEAALAYVRRFHLSIESTAW
jgi:hypothetical protein